MTAEKADVVVRENNALTNEKPKTIKQWIDSDLFRKSVAQALPKHITPERFVRVALTALMKNPELQKCSQESLFRAMLDLSSLGLEPDGRRAHLIPFRNNKTNTMDVQLIIDYKGLIELAKRSGEVKFWRSDIVCENDPVFKVSNGVVQHEIDYRNPRGKMFAVYSHVRNSNGDDDFEVMHLDDVRAIQARSKAGKFGPWVTDFNEMAKKTVMRRHSKRLTLSPEFVDALEKDEDKFEEPLPFSGEDISPKRISETTETIDYLTGEVIEHNNNHQEHENSIPDFNSEESEKVVEEKTIQDVKKENPNDKISMSMMQKIMTTMSECGGGAALKQNIDSRIKNVYKAKSLAEITNANGLDMLAYIKNNFMKEPGSDG